MVLRHNATRRRRLAIDPQLQGTDAEEARETISMDKPRPRNRKLYKPGAERRSQWKTTDLLPKRTWGLIASMSFLVLAIAGLNALFLYSERWQAYLGSTGVAALQLSGRATLAAWFSSFLLIISGFASLQIYALRQHRQDDYRGSYRLWLWMAVILLLASINCIVDLTSIGTHLIQSLTQLSFSSSLSSMIALKVALLTGLVARGSYEVRESRSALALVVLVWIAHGAAATLQLPQLHPVLADVAGQPYQLAHGNLLLAGTTLLFAAHLVFARFVYLQALGMIKAQPAKKKKSKAKAKTKSKKSPSGKSAASTSNDKKKSSRKDQKIDDQEIEDPQAEDQDVQDSNEPQEQTQPTRSRAPATPTTSKQLPPLKLNSVAAERTQRKELESELEDEDPAVLKLSKSEQRRQRKQQQQQSHRRAA